jgi:hypothetical protein
MSFLGIKIYRNIYVKDYKRFPYQMLSGRDTLLYKGKIFCDVAKPPKEYDPNKDYYITCDCDFSNWKNLKRIV